MQNIHKHQHNGSRLGKRNFNFVITAIEKHYKLKIKRQQTNKLVDKIN